MKSGRFRWPVGSSPAAGLRPPAGAGWPAAAAPMPLLRRRRRRRLPPRCTPGPSAPQSGSSSGGRRARRPAALAASVYRRRGRLDGPAGAAGRLTRARASAPAACLHAWTVRAECVLRGGRWTPPCAAVEDRCRFREEAAAPIALLSARGRRWPREKSKQRLSSSALSRASY